MSTSKLSKLLALLDGVKEGSGGFTAKCPAHEDKGNHLSIKRTENGKVLIHCYKGCSTESIMSALDMTTADLFDDAPPSPKLKAKQTKETVWDIVDLEWRNIAQHVRYDYVDKPKDYAWYRDGKKGLRGLKTANLPLYRINQIVDEEGDIFIVEGEGAADSLATRGYRAVGTVTGAASCPSIASIRDVLDCHGWERIYLWPDNDDVGHKHMDKVGEILATLGTKPYIINWEDAPPNGDAADHTEPIEYLIQTSCQWQESTSEPAGLAAGNTVYNFTDIGNSKRLIGWCDGSIAYISNVKKWLLWDGRNWSFKDYTQVMHKCECMIMDLYAQAAKTQDKTQRKELAGWAIKCESYAKISPMVELAKTQPDIQIDIDDLDKNTMLLGCPANTIDLSTGDILQPNRFNYITKKTTINIDLNMSCDMWQAFLIEIMDGNEEMINFLQRAIGYSLTGDTSERCIFILWGSGANGKSTLMRIIGQIMGDYSIQASTEMLMTRKQETVPNDIARLKGTRCVTASETSTGQQFEEKLVKQLTGGDRVSARFMRSEWFDFLPTHKIWLATNHKPVIKGNDKAIWDRIRLIPFTVAIPEDRQDKHLATRLMEEAPGILAWMLKGCLAWQEHGLGMPQEVAQATKEYQAEQDSLGDWLEQCCDVGPQQSAAGSALYKSFIDWTLENGEKPMTNNQLGGLLRDRGFERIHTRNGKRWEGVGIRTML